MGGTLQKVFQGRDDQKGHGIRLSRAILPSFLFLSYAGIILNLAATKFFLWFCFSILAPAAYAYLFFIKRQRRYSFEIFFSFMLLMAGFVQMNGSWLHVFYLPFLVALSVFFGPGIVIPLSIAVPFLEARHFIRGNLIEEISVSALSVLGGMLVSIVLSKTRREKDRLRKSIDSLKKEAEDIDFGAPADVFGGEGFVSQHLLSASEANEEMREILLIARRVLSADSVNMFAVKGSSLQIRCTTEASNLPAAIDEKAVSSSIKYKKSIVSDSGIATPVIDGSFVVGAVYAHKDGSGRFRDIEVKIFEMFSKQMAGVLQRQRIYSQMLREHIMLRKLKEGGSRLITSLKIDDIARSLIDAVYNIAPMERVAIALFLPKSEGFELIRQIGFTLNEGTIFDLRNTRMGLVSKSREPDYISDLSKERNPVLPFKAGDEGSVFIFPLSYEKELLGILVFLSPEVNALRPYEVELLKALGGQASSSLANARFHMEMERMAITDGLTGICNHRNFQEVLSSEFRKLKRFSEPLSLLLIDIDFFKKVNDTYGHPAGDEVLRGVSQIIKETMRNIDVPARYGGEEFAALLSRTDHAGSMIMAERLRKSVEEKVFGIEGKDLRVTISIGAATSPYDAKSKEELIEKADQALYHAKRNGRNRCVLWKDIVEK